VEPWSGAPPVAQAGCVGGDAGPATKRKGGEGRPGEEAQPRGGGCHGVRGEKRYGYRGGV
jgi:hypothetical protein